MTSIGRCSSTPALIAAHPVQNQAVRSPMIMVLEDVVAVVTLAKALAEKG
jgi:hypothetical protein